MNERIEELWSQAGGHYNSGNQHTWPEYTIGDPDKFAELIIKECAKVAWHNTPETDELEYSHLIKDKILEHFGVEE
jgi:hypothetical protein